MTSLPWRHRWVDLDPTTTVPESSALSRSRSSRELTVTVLGETVCAIRVVQPIGGRLDEAGVDRSFEGIPHGSFGNVESRVAWA